MNENQLELNTWRGGGWGQIEPYDVNISEKSLFSFFRCLTKKITRPTASRYAVRKLGHKGGEDYQMHNIYPWILMY